MSDIEILKYHQSHPLYPHDVLNKNGAAKRKAKEKEDLDKKEAEDAKKGAVPMNSNLRYQEMLNLDRKGYQAIFKSITRKKRDNQLDGTNHALNKVPAVAQYKPKYKVIDKNCKTSSWADPASLYRTKEE